MSTSKREEGFLTVKELAHKERVDRSTVFRWMRSGRIDVRRLGHRTRVRVRLSKPNPEN